MFYITIYSERFVPQQPHHDLGDAVTSCSTFFAVTIGGGTKVVQQSGTSTGEFTGFLNHQQYHNPNR